MEELKTVKQVERVVAEKEKVSAPPKEKEEVKKQPITRPTAPLVTTKDLNAYASQNNRDRPMSEQERRDL